MKDATEEKRARSEAQRRDALFARQQLDKQRAALVANSLKNVDSGVGSKRKVFDSDSENDGATKATPRAEKTSSKHKVSLFDSDAEEDDVVEEPFAISNRHSGKKGEKLMKLEARFGNDSRFRLDDKFASDNEDDEEENKEEGESLSEEKNAQKRILEKVLGHSLKAEPKKPKARIPAARPFTRFDPDNEEHVAWMQKFGGQNEQKDQSNAKKESPTTGGEDDAKASEAEPDADSESDDDAEAQSSAAAASKIICEMDQDFAAQLRKKLGGSNTHDDTTNSNGWPKNNAESSGFSFLKMIGRRQNEEPMDDVGEAAKPTLKNEEEDIKIDKKMERVLKGGSTKEAEIGEDVSTANLSVKTQLATQPFFITGEEPFVRSVVSNFRRVQSEEKIISSWAVYRESIIKVANHLRRNARRNKKERGLKYNYGHKNKEKTDDH